MFRNQELHLAWRHPRHVPARRHMQGVDAEGITAGPGHRHASHIAPAEGVEGLMDGQAFHGPTGERRAVGGEVEA